MKKIIFSRKGYDDSYGGGSSAIMPNCDLISFPIPVSSKGKKKEKGIAYTKLDYKSTSYASVMKKLNLKMPENQCHLDPDLIEGVCKRHPKWHGAFGQQGAAQTHLEKQKVGIGDIFLFFGTFKRTSETEPLRFERDHPRHIIFGYLKIGDILKPHLNPKNEIYKDHPHFVNRKIYGKRNAVYVAKSKNDYGTFKYDDKLVLTKNGYKKSFWELPEFFYPTGDNFSRHSEKDFEKRDSNVLLGSRGIGQDFVVSSNKKAVAWAEELISTSVCMQN